MFPNHDARKLMLTLFVSALPMLALAQVEPEYGNDVGSRKYYHDQFFPQRIYYKLAEIPSESASTIAQNAMRLGAVLDNVTVDTRSGRIGTMMPATPLLPGAGVGNNLSWSAFSRGMAPKNTDEYERIVWQAFVEYLQANGEELEVNVHELIDPGHVTVHQNGDIIQVNAPRQYQGIPVRGAYINGVINRGNLILFGIHGWGDIDLDVQPSVSEEEARNVLTTHLGNFSPDQDWDFPELTIVTMASNSDDVLGQGYDYRLAWALRPHFSQMLGEWEGLVDAHSGELLAFQDMAHYLADPEHQDLGATGATREIRGGVLPVSNDGVAPDGVEQEYPIPFADMTVGGITYHSDSGGNLPLCVDGEVSTTLRGLYVTITDDCGSVTEATSTAVLDLGFAPSVNSTNCDVSAGASLGNTRSTRSGFYEINRLMQQGRHHLPNNTWLTQPLPVQMNINLTCNATGGPGGLRFYRQGGGCANTGEIAGVFDHEWGHGMDGSDATPGISIPGEGIADIYASLRLNTSCIGRNFRLGNQCPGYGDACTSCDGVRDIDWRKKASNSPHDVAWADPACGSGGPAPCGGSVHCEGHVYSESVYDLYNFDLQGNYGMSLDTARELVYRLTFVGSGGVTNWFQCITTGFAGCNADGGYLNYLAADDDNGDLNDGTPHMQAIFDAFNRHGAACDTPTVQDAGCAGTPTTAPTVMTTAQDRGAVITWNAIAGATAYRVFRTEGVFDCDFGKDWITTTTDTTYIDTGLKNGFDYYYIVTPMGNGDSCFGPASACAHVTPAAGANFSFDPNGSLLITGGDADVFLDNCETGTYSFDVQNIGAGTLTNLRIIGLNSPTHGETIFNTALPSVIAANVAAGCNTVSAQIEFEARGLAYNDTLEIEVEVTSDEMSPQSRIQVFSIAATESDFRTFDTLTYSFETDFEGWVVENGTFNRQSSGGANGTNGFLSSSANTPNVCDIARSPIVQLSATSTLSLWNQFDIEPGTPFYDRANISIIDTTDGDRTVISPDGGRTYNASGTVGSFCTDGEEGFAATMDTWAESTWSATALDSAGIAGNSIQLEARYGTDGGLHLGGFWFDEVTFTDVDVQVADTQDDSCNSCLTLTFDDWPTNTVVDFIFCQNLATRVAKRATPDTTSGAGEE